MSIEKIDASYTQASKASLSHHWLGPYQRKFLRRGKSLRWGVLKLQMFKSGFPIVQICVKIGE